MPIISRNRETNEITNNSYAGRVLKVERVKETRNVSDTLDYSDYRTVESTYALVWLGTRGVPAWTNGALGRAIAPLREDTEGNTWNPVRALEFNEQFAWVDCTTLCPWRDQDDHIAEVDAMADTCDPMMLVNYVAWCSHQDALRLAAAQAAELRAEKQRQAEEDRVRNRPELGKRMKVVKGRKVKPGYEGTVAYIRGDSVLLKADGEWKDRNAQGVWVPAAYLAAR